MVLLVRLRARCVRAPVGRCDGSNCQRCCCWCVRVPGAFGRLSAVAMGVISLSAVLLLVRSRARCVRAPVSGVVVGGAFVRPVRSRACQRGCYWCVRAPGAFARPGVFMTAQSDKRTSCRGLKPRRSTSLKFWQCLGFSALGFSALGTPGHCLGFSALGFSALGTPGHSKPSVCIGFSALGFSGLGGCT